MCDHHQLRTQGPFGEIEHVNFLSENIGGLFHNEDYSDITLVVESSSFPAHKVILAARSEYFRALLFGGLRESSPECSRVELKDTRSISFQSLLKYIYTGRMNLKDMKEEHLLDVLGLAHRYGFEELEAAISDYLKATLNARNVCQIYDIASMFSLHSLCQTCLEFMDRNAAQIIQTESFLMLSEIALHEVISRGSFFAPEIDIFKAVKDWANKNHDVPSELIVQAVRLPLMSIQELLNTVRPTGLVSADSILDAIKVKNECHDMELNYRGFLIPDENVATMRHNAQVMRGEMRTSLLDGDSQNYDLDRGFTCHPIDDNQGQGVVIKLGHPCIINNIKMLLWDRDTRSYSYYIEVSMDEKDWVRVIDHTGFLCRSWQNLRFPERVVRYIQVVGTHNTVNRVFHLVSFECMYTRSVCNIEDGIIVPAGNVATIQASACVIEGVSRSRNALINGDTKNYDWDSGYTCHQLGSGAIVVQLTQPYMISSMRLLLWDCDQRSYSYSVEVSTDQQIWSVVADRSKEACRSWQTITFPKRPITFIKIVGSHNTANEVFHCVHFECPIDPAVDLGDGEHQMSSSPDRSAVLESTVNPCLDIGTPGLPIGRAIGPMMGAGNGGAVSALGGVMGGAIGGVMGGAGAIMGGPRGVMGGAIMGGAIMGGAMGGGEGAMGASAMTHGPPSRVVTAPSDVAPLTVTLSQSLRLGANSNSHKSTNSSDSQEE